MCEDASFRDLTKPREGPIHQILGTSELQITVQPSMRRLCFPSYEKASGFVVAGSFQSSLRQGEGVVTESSSITSRSFQYLISLAHVIARTRFGRVLSACET